MLNTGGTGRAAFRPDHSPEHLVLSGFFRSFKLGEESPDPVSCSSAAEVGHIASCRFGLPATNASSLWK